MNVYNKGFETFISKIDSSNNLKTNPFIHI